MSRSISAGTAMSVASSVITAWPATIFCWFKNPDNTDKRIFKYDLDGGTNAIEALVSVTTDKVRLFAHEGSTDVNAELLPAYSGTGWEPHVFVVDSASSLIETLFGGSAEVTTNKVTFQTLSSPTFYVLGDNSAAFTNAKMAHLTLWDGVALSSGDRTSLVNGTDPSTINTPTAHWDFLTSSLTDSVGSLVLAAGSSSFDGADDPTLGGSSIAPIASNHLIALNNG